MFKRILIGIGAILLVSLAVVCFFVYRFVTPERVIRESHSAFG